MVKAVIGNKVMLGLSFRNLELLKQDKPIVVKLNELGLETEIEVVIFSGENEETMTKSFMDANLIHPEKTQFIDHRRKQNNG